VNLPRKHKGDAPRYQDVPPEKIPVVALPGGKEGSEVRVIAGSSCGHSGPVDTRTPITYVDVRLQPGDELVQPTPASENAMAYVYRGAGVFGPERKPAVEGDLVLFAPGSAATLRATDGAPLQCLFLAGEPLGEPIVSYGPFVMNTEEEIYQAFEDYRSGRFGAIAGADERRAATDAARAKSTAEGRR